MTGAALKAATVAAWTFFLVGSLAAAAAGVPAQDALALGVVLAAGSFAILAVVWSDP